MRYVILLLSFLYIALAEAATPPNFIQTRESQQAITPAIAIKKLQDGNSRFLNNTMRERDFALQAKTTAKQGQAPFAVILSCMDSRGSPEIIFDQGIGDIFSLRVAGNVNSPDILASLEYATRVVGSKVIVVMGHSLCGAVESACKDVKLGHITALLQQIKPAVNAVDSNSNRVCDVEMVNRMAKQNVINTIKSIKNQSPIIDELLAQGKIAIVGGFQEVGTGKIAFFNEKGQSLGNN